MSGELPIERTYLRCRCCGYSEKPLDALLEIEELPNKITRKTIMEIAFYGQNQSSFKDAQLMIEKALGMYINSETIREITEMIGKNIFEEDLLRAKHTLENISKIEIKENPKKITLYIQIDGAAVNTRVEDLNGSTWRENKLVMAFTDKDMIRRKNGDHTITKKEYMSYIGSVDEFKAFVLDVAVRAGYGTVENVVIIADGATWIRNMCDELFPDAVQILDLFHLRENIYSFAKHLYGSDSTKYTAWSESIIYKIEKGKIEEVMEEIPIIEKLPTGIVNLKKYLENNIDKINYCEYREKGFFVGSGAIESGNKLILQKRLKQAGMRWGVDGAQSVLSLRAKVESGLWEKEVRKYCA